MSESREIVLVAEPVLRPWHEYGKDEKVKCFVVFRNGRKMVKVPARLVAWEDVSTKDMHFKVEQIDYVFAEEWKPNG